MKTYTAMITNSAGNTRSLQVFSFSMDGLRTRLENLILKPGEVISSLFPTDRMEPDFRR